MGSLRIRTLLPTEGSGQPSVDATKVNDKKGVCTIQLKLHTLSNPASKHVTKIHRTRRKNRQNPQSWVGWLVLSHFLY